jgi:hypothetical protein
VIQLNYQESSADGPDHRLMAFSRHTGSLKFATFYQGHGASAPGKYRPEITDTDIHGEGARHPWVPIRDQGGRRVIRLVHRSLSHRGIARVKVRATGDGRDVVRVRIDLADCTLDPPLYPVDCEVRA